MASAGDVTAFREFGRGQGVDLDPVPDETLDRYIAAVKERIGGRRLSWKWMTLDWIRNEPPSVTGRGEARG